jgi:hypothetical protein
MVVASSRLRTNSDKPASAHKAQLLAALFFCPYGSRFRIVIRIMHMLDDFHQVAHVEPPTARRTFHEVVRFRAGRAVRVNSGLQVKSSRSPL